MRTEKTGKALFHRLFILFIILILPAFFIKEYRIIKAKKETQLNATSDFSFFDPTPYQDKGFTFIVLTKNDLDTIDENFQSILSQKYSDFRVVYIDQGSTDGTHEYVRKLIDQHQVEKRFSLICCNKDYEVFEHYYNTIHSCPDEEVIVHIHANDWLVHDEVLDCLNHAYINPDVWLTYGQYFDFKSYKKGIYKPLPKKNLCKKRVRRAPWVNAPMKTFSAGIFKQIQLEEQVASGYFLALENENSLLLPMVELAKAHVRFIPDVLYIHNPDSKAKPGLKLAIMAEKFRTSVPSIPKKEINNTQPHVADLILLSSNHPEQLRICLTSVQKHVQGLGRTYVLYHTEEENYIAYENLKACYPHIHFVRTILGETNNFRASLLSSLIGDLESPSYVLLSTDTSLVNEDISLSTCISAMRKTRAYGFYFHIGRENEQHGIEGSVYSWIIGRGKGNWQAPNSLQMGLYRRIDLERDFKEMPFQDLQSLVESWATKTREYHIGLFFDHPKLARAPQ